MKSNKASGLEGLKPVEFYQCFRDQLSSLFLIYSKNCNVDLSTHSGYISYPQIMWKIYVNFRINFIPCIKILYKTPIFRLKNNGWISRTCQMHLRNRQGCPISASLYLFVAEILSDKFFLKWVNKRIYC